MVGKQLATLVEGGELGSFSRERERWSINCYRSDLKYRDFWLRC